MKVIVAGSRSIQDKDYIFDCIRFSEFEITELVSGGAIGPDMIGEEYAISKGIEIVRFKPDWDLWGRRAGMIRNEQMGDYADALIAVWDGKSKGTKHMFRYMMKLGKEVRIHQRSLLTEIPATLF